jgi:hypothetical protein
LCCSDDEPQQQSSESEGEDEEEDEQQQRQHKQQQQQQQQQRLQAGKQAHKKGKPGASGSSKAGSLKAAGGKVAKAGQRKQHKKK